jgi:hypothetical protein
LAVHSASYVLPLDLPSALQQSLKLAQRLLHHQQHKQHPT